jgi:uncharacterized protein (TIGR00369 family)
LDRFSTGEQDAGGNMDAALDQAIRRRIQDIPIVGTLGIRIDALESGVCRASVARDVRYDGVYASLHGGLLMTIADSIACFAIMTLTGPDQTMTTTDMNIRFLAPCRSDVRAVARVIKRGRTLCPVAIDLHDAGGVPVAVAQVTYILLSDKSAPGDDSAG